MKKKYTISLIVLVALLTVSLSLCTSYGIWKITQNEKKIATGEYGCFEMFFNDGEYIDVSGFKPLNEENGKNSNAYTFSIKNTCDETKTAEIRLNLFEDNTLDTRALTVFMTGDIDLGPIKFNELKNSRTSMDRISNSKILSSIEIQSGETVRTNLKTWIDEKIVSNFDSTLALKGIIEVTDKESIVLPTFKETILNNNGGKESIDSKESPDFNTLSSSNEGLYKTTDQDGESYYYRGSVVNNYVSFGDMLWRIVRVNGDETIRLILDETIDESVYNQVGNAYDYTGYTYQGNTTIDSDIKKFLDNWYKENIENNKLDKYVSSSKFCNDTSNYQEGYKLYYKSITRLVNTKSPTLACDATTTDYGGLYRSKVGLITADELMMAGANIEKPNSNIYINNKTSFYTMTPSDYEYYMSYVFAMDEEGSIVDYKVNSSHGVRPVISLKSSLVVVGDGTKDNPYKIDKDAN